MDVFLVIPEGYLNKMVKEIDIYYGLIVFFLVVALSTFITGWFVTAPYGRYLREGWGRRIPFVYSWTIMETPACLGMALWFLLGDRRDNIVAAAFLVVWQLHYFNRTFIYSWQRRNHARSMPVSLMLMGFILNCGNSYINGRWLFYLAPDYSTAWLYDPRFIAGAIIFVSGWAINVQSDAITLRLRKSGGEEYRIPYGGLFRWVSCPNYLGEIMEWTGWAIATWSLPGLVFALWTISNLAPRAWSHHKWFKEKFSDYPKERRALLPLVF